MMTIDNHGDDNNGLDVDVDDHDGDKDGFDLDVDNHDGPSLMVTQGER